MSTETLTAPSEELAADAGWNTGGSLDDAEFRKGEDAPAGSAEAAKNGAATESGASGDPGVKDELIAQFEAEAAAEAAAKAGTEGAAAQAGAAGPPSRMVKLLTLPLRIVIGILVVLDFPFAFLGAGGKRVIGGVAIITAVMAAATWIGGPRLATTLAAQVQEKPVVVKEEGESGEKKEAAVEKHGEKLESEHH